MLDKFKKLFSSKTVERKPSRKEVKEINQRLTDSQVQKILRLKKENPKLSNVDIARIIGCNKVVVRYWLNKKTVPSKKRFNKAEYQKQWREKNRERTRKYARESYQKKNEGKVKRGIGRPKKVKAQIKIHTREKKLPTLDQELAKVKIDELYTKEKYPVEHQADPTYFEGANPSEAVANKEAFDDQKRRNNINRVNTAKMLSKTEEISAKEAKENKRKTRLRTLHQSKKYKIHFDCCPSCNPKSNLSVDEYNTIVYKDFLRQKKYSQKMKELQDRQKELDKESEKHNVENLAQEGAKLCKKCDIRLSYEQATRSKAIHGEYYCQDHEPRLDSLE